MTGGKNIRFRISFPMLCMSSVALGGPYPLIIQTPNLCLEIASRGFEDAKKSQLNFFLNQAESMACL